MRVLRERSVLSCTFFLGGGLRRTVLPAAAPTGSAWRIEMLLKPYGYPGKTSAWRIAVSLSPCAHPGLTFASGDVGRQCQSRPVVGVRGQQKDLKRITKVSSA
eukprot:2938933-Rhodomonas_salina.1